VTLRRRLRLGSLSVVAVAALTFAALKGIAEEGDASGPAPQEGHARGLAPREGHASGPATTLHYRTVVDGQRWSMSSFHHDGIRCLVQKVPDESAFTTCPTSAEVFSDARVLWVLFGARQRPVPVRRETWDNAWVLGFAAEQVAAVEVQDARCRIRRLRLDADGAFFHVVSRRGVRRGELPRAVIARGEDGKVLQTKALSIGRPGEKAPVGSRPPRCS
jgi:hypothetical protein